MVGQTKVFVGSLPSGTKAEELKTLFENFGVVTECDIMNRCGFVHMQTEDMAAMAIQALNNTPFKGTNIVVEQGRIKERNGPGGNRGPPRGPPGGRGGGGPMRGRGGGQNRSTPYSTGNRGGGQGSQGYGSNRFDNSFDQQGYGGFGGEDRRGFALPNNQFENDDDSYGGQNGSGYGNRNQGSYNNQGQGYKGGFGQGGFGGPRNTQRTEGSGSYGGPKTSQRGGSNFGAPRGGGPRGNFQGRSQGGFGGGGQNDFDNDDMFSRRPSAGQQSNRGGYNQQNSNNGGTTYGQQFPPLGGNRNQGGAPRQAKPSRFSNAW